MIYVLAAREKNINNVAAEMHNNQNYKRERGDSVIETDAIKFELAQYQSPLQEVRDSL